MLHVNLDKWRIVHSELNILRVLNLKALDNFVLNAFYQFDTQPTGVGLKSQFPWVNLSLDPLSVLKEFKEIIVHKYNLSK